MPPVFFSGSLAPKKKAELQEIANSLHLSDQGTKEELQARIKKYLDTNPSLEDEPAFAGLFGRKKKAPQSVRSGPAVDESEDVQPNSTHATRTSRKGIAMEPAAESTPHKDVRTRGATAQGQMAAPPASPFRNVLEVSRREISVIVDLVKHKEATARRSAGEFVIDLRAFLSNGRNFYLVTAVLEVVYILRTIIPWKYFVLSLSAATKSPTQGIRVPYPSLAAFQSSALWLVLFHWALPTLILPWVVGTLISHQPTTSSNLPFDPVTASVTRLAAHVVYPYPTLAVKGVDVLGSRIRILSASLGVAFAFAEAIAKAPATFHTSEKDSTENVLGGLE